MHCGKYAVSSFGTWMWLLCWSFEYVSLKESFGALCPFRSSSQCDQITTQPDTLNWYPKLFIGKFLIIYFLPWSPTSNLVWSKSHPYISDFFHPPNQWDYILGQVWFHSILRFCLWVIHVFAVLYCCIGQYTGNYYVNIINRQFSW